MLIFFQTWQILAVQYMLSPGHKISGYSIRYVLDMNLLLLPFQVYTLMCRKSLRMLLEFIGSVMLEKR